MHTPSDWQAWLLRQARHYAVCEADANDLVQDCLHAYQRRFGRYPWEHAHTREAIQHARCWCQQKIHSLAIDRAKQPCRQRERLLDADLCEYLAGENPESDWIWCIAIQQFIDSLPPSLQKVAVLYNQGYEYAEIASALGLSAGSVKQYLQRIKQHGRAFFGLDVNKSGVCVVNSSESPQRGFQKEVPSDEETQGVADERVSADDSELGGAAEHPRRSRRTRRGGG
jgi:RNA polymerase sigma factor (sigma-70 family)